MTRILILALAALCFSATTQADNHGFDNFIEVELSISDISMSERGMVITYEGLAGKHGLVHATHNMASTNDTNSKGALTGDSFPKISIPAAPGIRPRTHEFA